MSKLVKQKKVKVNKNYKPYIYYTKWDKSFIQVQHRIATVWGYIYIFLLCLKPYEKIVKFTYEDNYDILRSDGFIGIKNVFTKKYRFMFIEADISNNKFDKIKKYNLLYSQQKKYLHDTNTWWLSLTNKFPTILILTHRPKLVNNKLATENINNLKFKVIDYVNVEGGL